MYLYKLQLKIHINEIIVIKKNNTKMDSLMQWNLNGFYK